MYTFFDPTEALSVAIRVFSIINTVLAEISISLDIEGRQSGHYRENVTRDSAPSSMCSASLEPNQKLSLFMDFDRDDVSYFHVPRCCLYTLFLHSKRVALRLHHIMFTCFRHIGCSPYIFIAFFLFCADAIAQKMCCFKFTFVQSMWIFFVTQSEMYSFFIIIDMTYFHNRSLALCKRGKTSKSVSLRSRGVVVAKAKITSNKTAMKVIVEIQLIHLFRKKVFREQVIRYFPFLVSFLYSRRS